MRADRIILAFVGFAFLSVALLPDAHSWLRIADILAGVIAGICFTTAVTVKE